MMLGCKGLKMLQELESENVFIEILSKESRWGRGLQGVLYQCHRSDNDSVPTD